MHTLLLKLNLGRGSENLTQLQSDSSISQRYTGFHPRPLNS